MNYIFHAKKRLLPEYSPEDFTRDAEAGVFLPRQKVEKPSVMDEITHYFNTHRTGTDPRYYNPILNDIPIWDYYKLIDTFTEMETMLRRRQSEEPEQNLAMTGGSGLTSGNLVIIALLQRHQDWTSIAPQIRQQIQDYPRREALRSVIIIVCDITTGAITSALSMIVNSFCAEMLNKFRIEQGLSPLPEKHTGGNTSMVNFISERLLVWEPFDEARK